MNERAELVFTFTDIFNDFALQHDITGNGFTALYQNFLETQVARELMSESRTGATKEPKHAVAAEATDD